MNFRERIEKLHYRQMKRNECARSPFESNWTQIEILQHQNEWKKKKPGGFASLKVFAIRQTEMREELYKKCMLHRNGLSKTDSNKVHFFLLALSRSLDVSFNFACSSF